MDTARYQDLISFMTEPAQLKRSEEYLSEQLRVFLRRQERILICFPDQEADSIGGLLVRAVRKADGIPLQWGADFRWKSLLKQAFETKATAIAGPPLVILGLTKLAKKTRTPLYFRNVLTAGYPCLDWMIDGIQQGLDCRTWGCYGPGSGPIAGGFSCGKSRGVHIREDAFSVEIADDTGAPLPEGELGMVVVSPKSRPALRYNTMERARLDTSPCACGRTSPRLMDLTYGPDVDKLLLELGTELMTWTSILDCNLIRGPHGLELEIITFPGEKLPKLPTCARLMVRPWDPERDTPFWFQSGWRNSMENG